jgi:hypothetical protein
MIFGFEYSTEKKYKMYIYTVLGQKKIVVLTYAIMEVVFYFKIFSSCLSRDMEYDFQSCHDHLL